MDLTFTRRRFISTLSSLLASLHLLKPRALSSTAPDHVASQQEYTHTNTQTIWFEEAANQWADALPVGNGRLGPWYLGVFRLSAWR